MHYYAEKVIEANTIQVSLDKISVNLEVCHPRCVFKL